MSNTSENSWFIIVEFVGKNSGYLTHSSADRYKTNFIENNHVEV